VLESYRRRPGGNPAIRHVSGQWSLWSVQWRWIERGMVWDKHLADQARAVLERRAREDGKKWAELRRQERPRELAMADQLHAKVEEMLALPVVEMVTEVEVDKETGKERPVQIVKPVRFTARDIARFMEVELQLRRLALDMPTSRDWP
jgi:hypothetical protein